MKLVLSLLLTFSITSATANTESIESEIWINNLSWEIAFNSGDTLALANLYTEDAVVISPNLEILNVQEEMKEFWIEKMLASTENFHIQTIHISIEGDLIYQTAFWVATKTSEGVVMDIEGEMTNVIARQDDGSWKIQKQSWN